MLENTAPETSCLLATNAIEILQYLEGSNYSLGTVFDSPLVLSAMALITYLAPITALAMGYD
ncbi:hypothetical protein A1QO_03950 [Vibrio genomosp. F10 str. ZF-129]|uniref:Uncharacterized protein n=1 Tax=Vibrio genomosp. F10 str. ZF-129 TaxID=1187848 RepID=A0A1E5BIK2_9VIBR|nr:hypothetical protein [Vibrio genomosp. F10]OEE37264.1 hypothetical protein A1QO_03950 [Vibrio genomosp. F10 str. ZF-129]